MGSGPVAAKGVLVWAASGAILPLISYAWNGEDVTLKLDNIDCGTS